MRTIGKIAIGSAVAFSAFAFTAAPGSADSGGPAIVPHGHYCASYTRADTYCKFPSYAECEAMVSGQSAECYGNTPADDQDLLTTDKRAAKNFRVKCDRLLLRRRRASPAV